MFFSHIGLGYKDNTYKLDKGLKYQDSLPNLNLNYIKKKLDHKEVDLLSLI